MGSGWGKNGEWMGKGLVSKSEPLGEADQVSVATTTF
jgi:hypothetical protein